MRKHFLCELVTINFEIPYRLAFKMFWITPLQITLYHGVLEHSFLSWLFYLFFFFLTHCFLTFSDIKRPVFVADARASFSFISIMKLILSLASSITHARHLDVQKSHRLVQTVSYWTIICMESSRTKVFLLNTLPNYVLFHRNISFKIRNNGSHSFTVPLPSWLLALYRMLIIHVIETAFEDQAVLIYRYLYSRWSVWGTCVMLFFAICILIWGAAFVFINWHNYLLFLWVWWCPSPKCVWYSQHIVQS